MALHAGVVLNRGEGVRWDARNGRGRDLRQVGERAHTRLDERVDQGAPRGLAAVRHAARLVRVRREDDMQQQARLVLLRVAHEDFHVLRLDAHLLCLVLLEVGDVVRLVVACGDERVEVLREERGLLATRPRHRHQEALEHLPT